MGSATAYFAAQHSRTVLLEQHALLHRRGSSHGESRIVRKTYASAMYTQLMVAAYELWDHVSAEAGIKLLRPKGGLSILPRSSADLGSLLAACEAVGAATEVLQPAAVWERYKLRIAADEVAVWQGDTATVGATLATATFQRLAACHGAQLRESAAVVGIAPLQPSTLGAPGGYAVQCADGSSLRAKRVVVCPGPWAAPVLQRLFGLRVDLTVWQCTVCYFKPSTAAADAADAAEAAEAAAAVAALPVLIDYGRSGCEKKAAAVLDAGASATSTAAAEGPAEEEPLDLMIYSCPCYEYGNLIKFAIHRGVPTTADGRSFAPAVAETVAPVQTWLRARAPCVDATAPVMADTCLYTMTRDEDFILDVVPRPGYEGVFLAAGFSGHGFKFAPVIGALLSRWAASGTRAFDALPLPSSAVVAAGPGPQMAMRTTIALPAECAAAAAAAFSIARSALSLKVEE